VNPIDRGAPTLVVVVRLPLPPARSRSGDASNEGGSAAGGGEGSGAPTLLVLATTSAPPSPQLAAAFDEVLSVPLLQSAEEALDALRAASLLPRDADGGALEAMGLYLSFPMSVKQLMREAEWSAALQ